MSDTSSPYVYKQPDGNRAAGNRARNQLEVLYEKLHRLADQAERTVDALSRANARADERAATRDRARDEVVARRSKGLA